MSHTASDGSSSSSTAATARAVRAARHVRADALVIYHAAVVGVTHSGAQGTPRNLCRCTGPRLCDIERRRRDTSKPRHGRRKVHAPRQCRTQQHVRSDAATSSEHRHRLLHEHSRGARQQEGAALQQWSSVTGRNSVNIARGNSVASVPLWSGVARGNSAASDVMRTSRSHVWTMTARAVVGVATQHTARTWKAAAGRLHK